MEVNAQGRNEVERSRRTEEDAKVGGRAEGGWYEEQ
jgi:hypothetical protein